MSHFSDDHNFREITQNKIITTSLVAWKQCASAFTLRQNKTGAFIAPDLMLFHISLQSICLSKTQTISGLLYRIVLVWILDITCLPVVRNIESKMKYMELKGKAAHY